ncbi:MAG TPA: hypothetical protein DEF45_07955 [Rhodopirellula sp.]|nr:hypothetical protein [Rhodopirellula sp.]
MNERQLITVTNGQKLYKIAPEQLPQALARGLSCPVASAQTLVGNGEYLFEIPVEDVQTANSDGFHDLLTRERVEWSQRGGGHLPPSELDRVAPPSSQTSEPFLMQPGSGRGGADNEIPDATRLMESVHQSEAEAEVERGLKQQELDQTEGWRWYLLRMKFWIEERRQGLIGQLRGSSVSLVVHVAVLLILASLFINVEDDGIKGIVIISSPPSETPLQEVVIEPRPLEVTEPNDAEASESPAPQEVVRAEPVNAPDFMECISGAAIKPPASAAAAGTGKAAPKSKPAFFGSKVSAVDYVFVIDNSNSMTKGRFETALNELLRAVSQLTARQRFYVIFYSDTAYPLFHPKPATDLVNATSRNKQRLKAWLDTVQLCLKTNGKEAITAAFALKPDVIFVLGDGAFTDKASSFFASRPQKKIPLHTLGMEVKAKDSVGFQKLAKSNGGTYKDVGVADGALVIAQRFPRKRNTTRGPIWGVNLRPKPVLK